MKNVAKADEKERREALCLASKDILWYTLCTYYHM